MTHSYGITGGGLEVDPHGDESLRAFGGGLLTTCGLDTFGGPTIDESVSYGQHGRISGTPARMTRTEVFVHHFDAEPSPTMVTLRNERRDLSLSLTFDRRELPFLAPGERAEYHLELAFANA